MQMKQMKKTQAARFANELVDYSECRQSVGIACLPASVSLLPPAGTRDSRTKSHFAQDGCNGRGSDNSELKRQQQRFQL